jgi:ABC-type uncharacterized transport system substrate-binding protein
VFKGCVPWKGVTFQQVQLPTRYELIINPKTATSLGIELPMSLMLSADQVID